MAREFEGETQVILDRPTHWATPPRPSPREYAIASAVIAAVALFAAFREIIAEELFNGGFAAALINIARPEGLCRLRCLAVPSCSCSRHVDPGGQPHRPAWSCRRFVASSRSPAS
ncbi:MAG: hypothetical protein R2704_02500 [Microthrixaceae bacterium]